MEVYPDFELIEFWIVENPIDPLCRIQWEDMVES